MIENLEGRTMFAVALPTEAIPPDQQLPAVQETLVVAKVKLQDINVPQKVNKPSPGLMLKATGDAGDDAAVPTDQFSLNYTKIKW